MTEPDPTQAAGRRTRSAAAERPRGRRMGRTLLRVVSTLLAVLWVLSLVRDWALPTSPDEMLGHIETGLATHMPAYAMLEEHDPGSYRRVGDAMRSALERGATPDEAALAGQQALGEVVDRYVSQTSPEAVTGYAQILVRLLGIIAARDARLCFDVLYRPAHVRREALESLVPQELAIELMQAQGRVIEDALRAPREPVSGQRVERLLRTVHLDLERSYGEDAALLWKGESGHRQAGRSRVCRMTLSMFEIALAMEDEPRALVLRHLLSP